MFVWLSKTLRQLVNNPESHRRHHTKPTIWWCSQGKTLSTFRFDSRSPAHLLSPGDVFAIFVLSVLALPIVPLNWILVNLKLAPLTLAFIHPCNLFCFFLFSCWYLPPGDSFCSVSDSNDSDLEESENGTGA